jgi:hypothetical protein
MSVPRLRDDICVREIDGEAVILDRAAEQMHSFNQTAACILRAIDGARTVTDLGRLLAAQFDVPPGTAFADASMVVRKLEELGLLRQAPEGAG